MASGQKVMMWHFINENPPEYQIMIIQVIIIILLRFVPITESVFSVNQVNEMILEKSRTIIFPDWVPVTNLSM